VPTRLNTIDFLRHLQKTLNPGGVVAFNINEHDRMADDIAAVTAAFGHAVLYRCPPADNKVMIAVEGGLVKDDEMRARVAALDKRFNGALSFDHLRENRE
jgi:spermidine synthase